MSQNRSHHQSFNILVPVCLFILVVMSSQALPATQTAPVDAADPGMTIINVEASDPADGDGSDNQAAGNNRPAPPMMPGWPQTMAVNPIYSPVGVVLADLDNDGYKEVLAGSTDNQFRVWHHNGVLLSGWPVNLGGRIQSKAAVADLDGDGDLEIIIAVCSGQLHVRHHDGTSMTGWPQPSGLTFGFLSPLIYDIDDDGRPEILVGGGSTVKAWEADGTILWQAPVTGTISGTLSAGDLTGDELPEILVTTTAGLLYALQGSNGSGTAGWPVTYGLSSSYAAPSIGDFDGDGSREALVVGYNFGVSTSIFAYRGDGTLLPNFPVTYPSAQTYSCPVLADIDGDGDLELWNAGKIDGNAFYAWDHTGALLPGWPVTADPNMEGSAIIANLDGIPGYEIAIGDNWSPGSIFGHNVDGTIAADFPIPKPGGSGPNSPEIADVDLDGDLEMAMTMTTGDVALWDFSGIAPNDAIEWGGLFHDNWNTSQHGFKIPTSTSSVSETDLISARALLQAWPNPFIDTATLRFRSGDGDNVTLTIHDLTGRTIRSLSTTSAGPGWNTLTWDGRAAGGQPAAGGIYFVKLHTASGSEGKIRIVLIR
ncbi:MAG: VCBS repeat-containing protein [Candidatus Eisenbacteria bacterium]|uniref:VCBS repeat-containing protein n=1 Tax=Eiseniibacteriota bacterium TaxID=2212470 RepID=A0A948RXA9_UNCEI|nr:VCBS repeat-containing protein [Candidatus Eisenbacteria bacterium]MBU1951238.1 VCBS repeat-containing protein [Candidatus Eisenbacteria bacterium]MBU2692750.1 VCBS repeat-containing protein [Candidatus Eisenbacteria bacterium]